MSSAKKDSFWLRLFTLELAVAAGLFILSFLFFSLIVNQVIYDKKDYFDSRIFDWISPYRTGEHTKIALFVTFFGTGGFLIPAYFLTAFLLWKRKKKNYALMTIIVALISMLLGLLLKEVFRRERPGLPNLDGAGGFSFPSGHTLGGFTFSGILIFLVWKTRLSTPYKWILSLLLFVFGALIALSRIYLHVHFATDTIGSFLLALTWLSLSFICLHLIERRISYNKQRWDRL